VRWSVALFAVYGAAHLASTAWFAVRARPRAPHAPAPARAALLPHQQPLVSALVRLLDEDGVPEAERWATAIVRASPSSDLGYLALVTAQIRRESHFLAPDLEWLYQSLVPDLVHELGVADPIRTIGPMQVQRWRLQDYFAQARGEALSPHTVKELAADIETGVAACVAVLDRIVVEYVPERRLCGWVHTVGSPGMREPLPVLARDFVGVVSTERRAEALRQKLLSDLTGEPLALDGVPGERTRALLLRFPELAANVELHARWRARFGARIPEGLGPRICHDPRLAYVLADFHSGPGACRTAALQALLNGLGDAKLATDGKWGPLTRAAAGRLLGVLEPDAGRRAEFAALLANGRKPAWVRDQLLALAQRRWRAERGTEPPDALVPDLWFGGLAQDVKGIGRISVEGYVAGSAAFYEDYLRRLSVYTGRQVPAAPRAGA
jgi:hypothetical protein